MPKTKAPKQYPIPTPTAAEWREGKKRFLAMLREVGELGGDELELSAEFRDGRPQTNLVYAHVFCALTTRSPGVCAAFAAMLTHYLGCLKTASDVYDFREMIREPVPMAWPVTTDATIAMRPFPTVGQVS